MRNHAMMIAALALAANAAGCAHTAELKLENTDALSFMLGTWADLGDERQVTEQWVRVHPRLMLGTGIVAEGEKLVSSEHLAIEVRDDGVFYVAHPSGQVATTFKLTRLAGRVEFENPGHDFPRRISYVRTETKPASMLSVEAEGVEGGKPRKLAWSLVYQTGLVGPEPLVKQVVVTATPAQIYQAFTTLAGVKSFFAPQAKVDAKPWGAYEMYFVPDAPAGSRGGEGCRFVELVPNERLAFTWNFPPSLPTIRHAHTLITIALELVQAEPGHTRVKLTQSGFRTGQEWFQGRQYFDRAWGLVLSRLQKRFAEGPVDWSAP